MQGRVQKYCGGRGWTKWGGGTQKVSRCSKGVKKDYAYKECVFSKKSHIKILFFVRFARTSTYLTFVTILMIKEQSTHAWIQLIKSGNKAASFTSLWNRFYHPYQPMPTRNDRILYTQDNKYIFMYITFWITFDTHTPAHCSLATVNASDHLSIIISMGWPEIGLLDTWY